MPAAHDRPVDHATLADFLEALAYPMRLELLDKLRFPHTLGELKVSPRRRESGQVPGRPAARQTVQAHLDKLVEADLIKSESVEQGGRKVPQYVVNSLKLYELTEELRRLSTMYAGRGPIGDATGTLAGSSPAAEAEGPRLVLVHGVYEGKAFPLDKASAQGGQWLIGRRRGLPVALDYDPFVSLENTVLTERGGRFAVADLGSKNGTSVNWVPLARGASRALRPGDVIGVGRSLLSFIPA
ncbi:MAG: FHA domain-containing protein [Halobacteriales archaeon]|nr:FHA domain-containing protein [Halobacteriales archaeon]